MNDLAVAPSTPALAAPGWLGGGPDTPLFGHVHVRHHPRHADVFLKLKGEPAWLMFAHLLGPGTVQYGRRFKRALRVGVHWMATTMNLWDAIVVEVRFERGRGLVAPTSSHRMHHSLWSRVTGRWALEPEGRILVQGPAGVMLSALIRTGEAEPEPEDERVVLAVEDLSVGRLRLETPVSQRSLTAGSA